MHVCVSGYYLHTGRKSMYTPLIQLLLSIYEIQSSLNVTACRYVYCTNTRNRMALVTFYCDYLRFIEVTLRWRSILHCFQETRISNLSARQSCAHSLHKYINWNYTWKGLLRNSLRLSKFCSSLLRSRPPHQWQWLIELNGKTDNFLRKSRRMSNSLKNINFIVHDPN